MGIWVLEGEVHEGRWGAVLIDSVSEHAFGPVFESGTDAHSFLEWGEDRTDPRKFSWQELEEEIALWEKDRDLATTAASDESDIYPRGKS